MSLAFFMMIININKIKVGVVTKMAQRRYQLEKRSLKTFRFPLTGNTVSKEGIQYIYGYCFEELVKGVL